MSVREGVLVCVCVSCICQRTDLAGEKMREKSDTNREYMRIYV